MNHGLANLIAKKEVPFLSGTTLKFQKEYIGLFKILGNNLAIKQVNYPVRITCIPFGVCYHDYRGSLFIKF